MPSLDTRITSKTICSALVVFIAAGIGLFLANSVTGTSAMQRRGWLLFAAIAFQLLIVDRNAHLVNAMVPAMDWT